VDIINVLCCIELEDLFILLESYEVHVMTKNKGVSGVKIALILATAMGVLGAITDDVGMLGGAFFFLIMAILCGIRKE
jgi:hypothetical protein